MFHETVSKSIPPGRNAPRNIQWTLEATGDIELIGALAPDAHVVVYFAPNTARGQYEAFAAAIADRHHAPSVLSCSWGIDEALAAPAAARAMDRLFQVAALKGITICCSSGDGGDLSNGHRSRSTFPASSPHVLSCGGTAFRPATNDEVVWSEQLAGRQMASSGGFSTIFERPDWQHAIECGTVRSSGRGVPDVAAKADLRRGYAAIVAHAVVPMGGTSAAAPLWAALIGRINQRLNTRAGLLGPLLYLPRFKNATRDIVRGRTSSRFFAKPGWNPCTGLGSPNGESLLTALEPDEPRP